MKMYSDNLSRAAWIVGAAALGAAAMYVLDPEHGKRRRSLARDKVYSAGMKARETVEKTARDLNKRARGLAAGSKNTATEDLLATQESVSEMPSTSTFQ